MRAKREIAKGTGLLCNGVTSKGQRTLITKVNIDGTNNSLRFFIFRIYAPPRVGIVSRSFKPIAIWPWGLEFVWRKGRLVAQSICKFRQFKALIYSEDFTSYGVILGPRLGKHQSILEIRWLKQATSWTWEYDISLSNLPVQGSAIFPAFLVSRLEVTKAILKALRVQLLLACSSVVLFGCQVVSN